MTLSAGIVLCILLAGLLFSIGQKKLTVPAALTGALLGWIIYAGGGFTGLAMMAAFFILGTAATSWKKELKLDIRSNAFHQLTRTTDQVLANAGVAGLAGLLGLLPGTHGTLLRVSMAASFAAAAADTLSSELGTVYGRRFFNVMTGRPDQKGLDGVVSIEGLLIGAAGAAIIGAIFMIGQGCNGRIFLIILLSGIFGNWADSVLGAVFERKGRLSNNMVNLLNTLAAALLAAFLVGLHVGFLSKPTVNKGLMTFFTALR
ncbi:MAG TPA: DUF92 domain-containing protein [Puia sp.]|jgi:uncharacterized protein (TIGR00297 family)|nr:DUF92 domain-containing protein [Puia sp.]